RARLLPRARGPTGRGPMGRLQGDRPQDLSPAGRVCPGPVLAALVSPPPRGPFLRLAVPQRARLPAQAQCQGLACCPSLVPDNLPTRMRMAGPLRASNEVGVGPKMEVKCPEEADRALQECREDLLPEASACRAPRAAGPRMVARTRAVPSLSSI